MTFNVSAVEQFFAQVALVFSSFNITKASQVGNLNETGFTPGKNMAGTRHRRVMTAAYRPACYPRPNFKRVHRITILATVSASFVSIAPAAVLRSEREPSLLNEVSSKRLTGDFTHPGERFGGKRSKASTRPLSAIG